ncbi:MAG: hemolysin family protein [Actinomycetota bacterium]|nr:hemolysin family protein [Actinomycetota bacterium]
MNLIAVIWRSSDTYASIAIVVLIAFSSFIALAETSLTRVSKVKAAALVEQRRRGANVLARLIEKPSDFLNAILLTGLVSQLIAATLVGIVADRIFGALGVVVAVIFEVIFIFIVAEALPKNYAVHHPETSALFSAPLISAIVKFPLIRLAIFTVAGITNLALKGRPYQSMNAVSEEELLAMADAAAEDEVIEDEEREIIASVIEFGDTVAREIMVPRVDIVAAAVDATIEEALNTALDSGVSRIPLFEDNLDSVVGLALLKDMVRHIRDGKGQERVDSIARKAVFVPETKIVSQLLREMQAGKYHLVVVVDEYGGTAGLVAMEDLIEELVGEIEDEYDLAEAEVVKNSDGSFLVKASKSIDEINDECELDLPTGDWESVGGLLLQQLGHLPTEGESSIADGVRIVAEKVAKNRILLVSITRVDEDLPLSEIED